MRWLVAPQEFKGTLTAREAAEAIAEGMRSVHPEWELDLCPLADGGPGTVDAALTVAGADERVSLVTDPLGRPVRARWAKLPGGRAVIEMATASGLSLLKPEEYAPLRTTTRGTGELLLSALAEGCTDVLLGVGGSATNDGGAGALQALGVRLLDERGMELGPGGAELARLKRVDTQRARWSGRLTIGTDVTSPLLGASGATHVFAKQKGATEEEVPLLEAALENFARVLGHPDGPRCGAAGGLAYGLASIFGAKLQSGFDAVAEFVSLRGRIEAAECIVTGEGRLDSQTAAGKGPARLAQLSTALGRPTFCVAGSVTDDADRSPFALVLAANGPGTPHERLASAAAELGRTVRL